MTFIRNWFERRFVKTLRLPRGFTIVELKEAFLLRNKVEFNVFNSQHRDAVIRAVSNARWCMWQSMIGSRK